MKAEARAMALNQIGEDGLSDGLAAAYRVLRRCAVTQHHDTRGHMTHSAGDSGGIEGRVDGDAWVTSRIGRTPYRADVSARGFGFTADEPYALGGTDAGPTPYEYLLGALGGCTAITLRMYADRKGWPLEGVDVSLRTARSHEPDCEECERSAVGITRLERKIELHGPLDDEQRRRLMLIADRCPVKQTMERGIRIDTPTATPV